MKLLLAALVIAIPAVAEVEEPLDFRMEAYRGPVPSTLEGGTVVSTEEAHALWQSGEVAFIDVLPRAPKPANLPEGTIWREQPRPSIPGAMWLPNVGYGGLADVMHAYFKSGLAEATDNDMANPVLFFCLDECWMSWNAAKRALEYGYANVYWYPEGTDGWGAKGYPLDNVEPLPGGQ